MTFTKNVAKMTAIAAAALLVSQGAQAQEFVNPDWANHATYIGAGIGQTRANFEDQSIIRSFQVPGLRTVNSWSSDERDVGYKLFVGKQLSRHFGVEASFFDYGKFDFNTTTAQGGRLGGTIGYKGVSLDLLGMMPFTDRFGAYGRVGMAYTKSAHSFVGDGQAPLGKFGGSDKKLTPKVGLGLEYKLSEALALRAEVERTSVTDRIRANGKADMYSLALVYKLGRPVAAPYVAPAPAPEPVVAPAPAPAPVVEAAPVVKAAPVPTSEKVSFAAEALFDFDKSVVKPQGKAALDDLLAKLKGMNTEVMVTVGHTDSIGSDEYNQKLSQRRAEAVKAYIVSKGIDTSRVYTEGKGETQPVADNTTSEGRAKNRRVTVEVVGTRN
jgi:OOP family OmpA-OmpF porin